MIEATRTIIEGRFHVVVDPQPLAAGKFRKAALRHLLSKILRLATVVLPKVHRAHCQRHVLVLVSNLVLDMIVLELYTNYIAPCATYE